MKRKPDARDFFVNTYPINAYPNPWDYVVDDYEVMRFNHFVSNLFV